MDLALRLDQPDLAAPGRSRRLGLGPADAPVLGILNGRGSNFEGGADEPALSLKWLAEGAAEYRTEGRSYRLAGPVQLALNRGQPYRMAMRGPSESFVLFFPKAAAGAAWQAQTGRAEAFPEIPTVAAASPPALQARLADLRTSSRSGKPDGGRLLEFACAVLNELAALAQERRRLATRLPAIRRTTREELLRRLVRAEAYLAEEGADATLAGAARAAALSPFHLIRVFDAVFGETPLAYAAGRRLDRAHAALRGGRQSIAEIALAAGYESRSAFDRAFVRRFRMTPGALREG
ncbi:MAG TPA: AraC family transcriptional regulator [Rhizomicrobium sp.]|nr:AraC family transcriptional regulator [Rhizomicrobium sp.]